MIHLQFDEDVDCKLTKHNLAGAGHCCETAISSPRPASEARGGHVGYAGRLLPSTLRLRQVVCFGQLIIG